MELLTTQEAVAYLGIARVTLMDWRKRGIVEARKYAGRWFFRKDDLDKALPPEVRETRKHA